MHANGRRLLWDGMFLFLLGLLTGLVEQRFSNICMGLLLTLKAMNGIFLVRSVDVGRRFGCRVRLSALRSSPSWPELTAVGRRLH